MLTWGRWSSVISNMATRSSSRGLRGELVALCCCILIWKSGISWTFYFISLLCVLNLFCTHFRFFVVLVVFFLLWYLFKNWATLCLSCHLTDWSFISKLFDPEKGGIDSVSFIKASRKAPSENNVLCASYRPALLLPCFCSACLDSFIQGNIFLFIGALWFCSLDLCAGCWCVAVWWVQSNPVTSAQVWLRNWGCWMLCAALLFCISMKCAPGPLLTLWRTAGSQMSHGRFPESPALLAWEDPGKKTETESGRRPHDPSYSLNSMLTWIASLSWPESNGRFRVWWKWV